MAYTLEIYDEHGALERVELSTHELIIGRSSSADIQLDLATVSRRHARLTLSDTGWTVTDLGSRSGTLVNGDPIEERRINPGDQIQISRYALRLVDDSATATHELGRTTTWQAESTPPEIQTLAQPPKIGLSHIASISAFGEALQQDPDPASRLRALCAVVAGGVLEGDWALALELDGDTPNRPPTILASAPQGLIDQQDVHISRTTIAAMLERGTPVMANNFSKSVEAVEMSIIDQAPATAVAACPLASTAEHPRLLYVCLPPQMAGTEWLAIVSLTAKAYEQAEAFWREREAADERAAWNRELDHAHAIQTSILPDNPDIPGFEIAWSFEPCERVGGDYLDVLPMPDGRVMVAIADVTGHGLGAALTTLSIHSILQTVTKIGAEPEIVMAMLNDHLCDYLPASRFVTMLVLIIDPETGQTHTINAGHHPPLAIDSAGETRSFAYGENLLLGIESINIKTATDQINAGETLLLFTDGLIEMQQPDGEMLNTPGLLNLFNKLHTPDTAPDDLAQTLRQALDELQSDQPAMDDQTFIILRRT